jgi:hypothetical protein
VAYVLGFQGDGSGVGRQIVQTSVASLLGTIQHTSANTHLTISPTAPTAVGGALLWTHTLLSAPKLITTDRPDGNTTSAGSGQFTVYTNSTASTNYPWEFGGGILYERAGVNAGAFQIWADTLTTEALYWRKLTAASTWSTWKTFAHGSGTVGRLPRWKTATELEATSWDATDLSTSPTKLRWPGSPQCHQMDIYGGSGICVSFGGRHSVPMPTSPATSVRRPTARTSGR